MGDSDVIVTFCADGVTASPVHICSAGGRDVMSVRPLSCARNPAPASSCSPLSTTTLHDGSHGLFTQACGVPRPVMRSPPPIDPTDFVLTASPTHGPH